MIELVPSDGVRVRMASTSAVSFEPALDLRRFRPPLMTRLMRFAVVLEPLETSESELELEESSEEESNQLATGPGADSSSMMCCGVLSYIYACDLSWKRRYIP